uniref:RING-type domain-containing protein n=1 Tax=Elaeophora elaphi TaxID=1147741 RepID=A0A0R3RG79_9BILA
MSRFLPPIMRNHPCCIDSHDLRISTESDGRQLYTYTVTWHDLQQFEQSNSMRNRELRSASPEFSFMNVSPRRDMSSAEMQICKRIAPDNTPSLRVRECYCDGPCGKIKPVSEMRIMGLCDHYICRDCFERAPAVQTAGRSGCPNVRCYQTDLACSYTNNRRRRRKIREIIDVPSHRTISTDKSDQEIVPVMLESRPCLCLVNVRLTTFTTLSNSDKVCRQQQIVEVYGDYTMLQTLNALKEYERFNSSEITNRVYYCPNGHVNQRSSWKHIRESDLLIPITKFGQENQCIDIIFDFTNA